VNRVQAAIRSLLFGNLDDEAIDSSDSTVGGPAWDKPNQEVATARRILKGDRFARQGFGKVRLRHTVGILPDRFFNSATAQLVGLEVEPFAVCCIRETVTFSNVDVRYRDGKQVKQIPQLKYTPPFLQRVFHVFAPVRRERLPNPVRG
jgi:hypothetical protein